MNLCSKYYCLGFIFNKTMSYVIFTYVSQVKSLSKSHTPIYQTIRMTRREILTFPLLQGTESLRAYSHRVKTNTKAEKIKEPRCG